MPNRIKEILSVLGIQQIYIAEKLGISKQAFNYYLNVKNPKKYNKDIANILGIDEGYLTKEHLSELEYLKMQRDSRMKNPELYGSTKEDKAGNKYIETKYVNETVADLDKLIESKKLMKEIYDLVIDERFNSTLAESYNTKYNMLKVFTSYLKKENTIEYSMLKDLLFALRTKDTWGYIPGVITESQRKEIYSKAKELLKKFDEENKEKKDTW